LLISINDWLRWKIPKPKSQIPNPNKERQRDRICDLRFAICDLGFGVWDLGFGIYSLRRSGVPRGTLRRSVPLRRSVNCSSMKPFVDKLPFELRLTRGTRGVVREFMRRLRVARAVHEQARPAFGS
jgi:hypothetical protein